jgi:TPR repeat protein
MMVMYEDEFGNEEFDYLSDDEFEEMPDEEKIEMLQKIVDDTSNPEALMMLGGIYYEHGEYKRAYDYYFEAYLAHHPFAANNLGYIFEYGRLGAVDHEKAFYYFSESALMDNENSLYKLGDFYYYGNFVAQNYRLAYAYYERALEASGFDHSFFSDITYRVALCLFKGHGVRKNTLEALRYINLSESAIYRDKKYGKFMWQSLMPKVATLKTDIMKELNADA